MQDVSHVFDLYLAAADYRAPPEFNNLTAEAVPESGSSALQPHVKPLASACIDVWWCKNRFRTKPPSPTRLSLLRK